MSRLSPAYTAALAREQARTHAPVPLEGARPVRFRAGGFLVGRVRGGPRDGDRVLRFLVDEGQSIEVALSARLAGELAGTIFSGNGVADA